jgi:S-adenosyl methyltransferase
VPAYDGPVADRSGPGPSQPHIARVYDYLLGGTDNFASDRAVGDQIIASLPAVRQGVLAQRALLGRVVRYLVGEAAVTQLLDIGSELPTAGHVHEVARQLNPRVRVAYVDNDPDVVSHSRALLAGDPATLAVEGDLRRPAEVLGHPEVSEHLDGDRPIGLLLCGILHYILDSERPGELIEAWRDALPPGSYVMIHHLVDAGDPAIGPVQAALQAGLGRGQFRTWEQVRSLFNGLELVEPGLVVVPEWRPDPGTPSARDFPVLRLACAGVARKP